MRAPRLSRYRVWRTAFAVAALCGALTAVADADAREGSAAMRVSVRVVHSCTAAAPSAAREDARSEAPAARPVCPAVPQERSEQASSPAGTRTETERRPEPEVTVLPSPGGEVLSVTY
jgi:hypothetical protein